MIWILTFIAAVFLDQYSKYLITTKITMYSEIPIINNFFYITYTRNSGAAWSMFQNGRYVFIVLTIIVCIAMIFYFIKNNVMFIRIALIFIISGAVGNLIDRVLVGSVVDFLEFRFGTYTFPIFNIADSCVVVGTILLAIYMLFIFKDSPHNNEGDK